MKLKIVVAGVAYEVDVEVIDAGAGFPVAAPLPVSVSRPSVAPGHPVAPVPPPVAVEPGDRRAVASPVAGTVLEARCRPGDSVAANQELFVIEAMKMKTSIVAPAAGRVDEVLVAPGDAVLEGQPLLRYS